MPAREINESWASYVRERMRRQKVAGPSELARASGVDQSVISRWLNEGRTPTVDALRRIAGPLETSLLDLMVAAGHITADEAAHEREAAGVVTPLGDAAEDELDEIVFRLKVPPNATPQQRELALRLARASAREVLAELDAEE